MISWTDVEVRRREHEQYTQYAEQSYRLQIETSEIAPDRWQWRMMNKLGGWLVETGCRLQTHVEQARQVVSTSQMALDANSNSTQPCP
jgi:hypothetical protein